MTIGRVAIRSLLAVLAASLMACGGGGGGALTPTDPIDQPPDPPIVTGSRLPADVHWQPPSGSTPGTGNFLYLQSEAGDSVGEGRSYAYTDNESTISFLLQRGGYNFEVGHPDKQWYGIFYRADTLRPGFYGNVVRIDSQQGTDPGMLWTSEWHDCARIEAWFVIDAVSTDGDGLSSLEMRFAQYCDGSGAALRGKLRWHRSEARITPIVPAPALWQPPPAAVPAEGSYMYLESDPGDYVGDGATRLFTKENAALDIAFYDAFSVKFYNVLANTGTETWSGNFVGLRDTLLRRGYYPGVQRYPYHSEGIGGMEWAREGRGCGRVKGWFAVDEVVYYGNLIVYLEVRFEQRCDLSTAGLRGKVRWSVFDFLPAPGPISAPPAGTWTAPEGIAPATGDFVYLESEAGDPVGQGQRRLFTANDAVLKGLPYTNNFHVRADSGGAAWGGDFRAMNSIQTLQVGYYGDLRQLPGHDPTKGGLAWSAEGRSCVSASGWVMIDRIARGTDGAISEIELRFEQRCTGVVEALRGHVRWSAAQSEPAPLTTLPTSLWQPPAGALPGSGNYVYLESDFGDPMGQGNTRMYTPADSRIGASGSAELNPGILRGFGIGLYSGSDSWSGRFVMPTSLRRWEPGLYGNLRGDTLVPVQTGAIEWSGQSFTCVRDQGGWYAIDSVSYDGDRLTSVELRFERHCDTFNGTLRGKVRWSESDTSGPPGPASAPAHLWSPPPGALPSSGNYLYLESSYGDNLGLGKTVLHTTGNSDISGFGNPGTLSFTVSIPSSIPTVTWRLEFVAMRGVAEIQPGHYANVLRYPSIDDSRAAMSVLANGSFCNSLSGWYVVDSVAYTNGVLSTIELRFEQHCERRSAPLRGKLRWSASS